MLFKVIRFLAATSTARQADRYWPLVSIHPQS